MQTGFDPRLKGPPEHIANVKVKDVNAELVVIDTKQKSFTPNYWNQTISTF